MLTNTQKPAPLAYASRVLGPRLPVIRLTLTFTASLILASPVCDYVYAAGLARNSHDDSFIILLFLSAMLTLYGMLSFALALFLLRKIGAPSAACWPIALAIGTLYAPVPAACFLASDMGHDLLILPFFGLALCIPPAAAVLIAKLRGTIPP